MGNRVTIRTHFKFKFDWQDEGNYLLDHSGSISQISLYLDVSFTLLVWARLICGNDIQIYETLTTDAKTTRLDKFYLQQFWHWPDPQCLKVCRNACELILIVSSRWSIISLSPTTSHGSRGDHSKKWRVGGQCTGLKCTAIYCTALQCTAELWPTCDKSGFGPPAPFAPGPPTLFFFGES